MTPAHRTYKLGAVQPGRIDRTVVEIDLDDSDQEKDSREFLSLPRHLRHEFAFDIVHALQKAYQQGREDRGAELHQLPGDGSWIIDCLRARLLGVLEEWGPGNTDPAGPQMNEYRVTLVRADEANGELTWEIGPRYGDPVRTVRMRLVIEEIR